MHVKEGTEIPVGMLLYEIDPAEYEVARNQAKASLDRAVADVERSKAESDRAQAALDRSARLRNGGGVSQEEYEAALANAKSSKAAVGQAEAAVEQGRATLEQAKLNLTYCKIYSPISGRVSRTLVTEGNLVGYGAEPTQLNVMVDQDPIYVFFDVPERDAIRFENRVKPARLIAPLVGGLSWRPLWSDALIPVEVGVETEGGFPHKGVLNFRDPRFEPGTGTIRLRGLIDNPDRKLSTGMFAKVRFPVGDTRPRLMVPVTAVMSDQRGRYLLVVGPDNVVRDPTVTLGPQVGNLVAIETGLKADDWVVVVGVQKARPKNPVDPEQKPMPFADAPAAPSVSAAPPKG